MAESGRIRVGVGGWTYAPWRETFYPTGLKHKDELAYASRQLTAIEINGTYYRLQTAASYAKWNGETPQDFVFSLKAPRYATARRVLPEAGDSLERFFASGLLRLGHKLGPILWQLPPTKRFEAEELQAFLQLLPAELGGQRLRHVLEVRHASFARPEFLALARRHRVATVFTDSNTYPSFADVTADFVYLRLMRSRASRKTGYQRKELNAWAERARLWASGGEPADLPRVEEQLAKSTPRDVFIYFINGAKERAPAAACQLIALLREHA